MPQSSTVPRLLTRYRDRSSNLREVIAMAAGATTLLRRSRRAFRWRWPRLLAHLGPEEPPRNAAIVCAITSGA